MNKIRKYFYDKKVKRLNCEDLQRLKNENNSTTNTDFTTQSTETTNFIWFSIIYRCSKCGKEYNQIEQFKKRDFPKMRIYYTPCCDIASVEIIEKR